MDGWADFVRHVASYDHVSDPSMDPEQCRVAAAQMTAKASITAIWSPAIEMMWHDGSLQVS